MKTLKTNQRHIKSANILDVNKQILEVKKKIQLSEGQRKAVFEIRETLCKSNSEEIKKLKRELSQLCVNLHENRSVSAKHRTKSGRLKSATGPLDEKPYWEVQETLDLHNIDKSKKLNVIQYQIQKNRDYLSTLAKEYQTLLSGKRNKELYYSIEYPLKIVNSELQNNIHAIKIQWREATHVNNRYKDIKKSINNDSACFEFNIKSVEEELCVQKNEIKRLHKIAEEAIQLKQDARAALLQQEKAALNAAKTRDHQESAGKRLVVQGKQELEKLEKRIFQSGKVIVKTDAENEDDSQVPGDMEVLSPVEDTYGDIFEILKQATGSTVPDEVVKRFKLQKETDDRLNSLRNTSEVEKKKLEKKQEILTAELEQYKYAEVKSAEQNLETVDQLKTLIQEQEEFKTTYEKDATKIKILLDSVSKNVLNVYYGIHSMALTKLTDVHKVLELLREELQEVMKLFEQEDNILPDEVEKLDIAEDKLPPPYGGLVRQTPVPHEDELPIPPTAGSEDEEEVPTRGYLKRQAQLVVDTRTRRKNIRIPKK